MADDANGANGADQKALIRDAMEVLATRAHRPVTVLGFVVSGTLVAISGGIHLYLWNLAYQNVATIGPLFLVQVSVAVITAALLVFWRKGAALLVGFGLMIGTVIGFVLALTTGLFGFKLTFWTGWAYFAIVDELVAAMMLAITVTLLRHDRRPATTGRTVAGSTGQRGEHRLASR